MASEPSLSRPGVDRIVHIQLVPGTSLGPKNITKRIFGVFRFFQFCFASVILILTAYGMTFSVTHLSAPYGLGMSILSLVIITYYFVSTNYRPSLYSRWLIFFLELTQPLIWISSFLILVLFGREYLGDCKWVHRDYGGEHSMNRECTYHDHGKGKPYRTSMYIAGGFAMALFNLHLITLIVFSVSLCHYKRARMRSKQGQMGTRVGLPQNPYQQRVDGGFGAYSGYSAVPSEPVPPYQFQNPNPCPQGSLNPNTLPRVADPQFAQQGGLGMFERFALGRPGRIQEVR